MKIFYAKDTNWRSDGTREYVAIAESIEDLLKLIGSSKKDLWDITELGTANPDQESEITISNCWHS